jgi:membrane protease subunit HflK
MPPTKYITPRTDGPQPVVIARWFTRGAVALLVFWFIFSGFSQVPADSVGVLTRFGKYIDTVQPGLRFKFPLGIDQLDIVPVKRQMKLEFGSTENASAASGYTNPDQKSEEPEAERSMVTGDLNMALVEWVVQYRIEDAKAYLFNAREPGSTARDAAESAVREVVGDRTVDEVLTVGRQEIEAESLSRLSALAVRYGLGITINQVQLKGVHPPLAVQASFNEVNQAQQEREQAINMANGEYNKAVPRTKGMAAQRITEAEGYALKRVNEARGDADKFTAQLTEYLKAPEVTRQRLYLEAMSEVLPTLSRKIILDSKAGQILPLMPLDLTTGGAAK